MLDQARFFVPILTPSFFRSEPCRQELRTFLDLERKVGRRDLVLPIYWITCPVLEEGHLKAKDELAQEIDERQRWDWRELVFEDLKSACLPARTARTVDTDRASATELCCAWSKRRSLLSSANLAQEAARRHRSRRLSRKPEPKSKPKSAPKRPKPTPTLWTPGEVFRDIDVLPWCPEMVKIPAGTFLMGSPEDEKGRRMMTKVRSMR